jgi:predicted MPP superfamily phosphohydrolase
VDLFCAGHVHGGQIAMPFYGALVTLSRYGKQYEAGLYKAGPMWLYVSRGVGMEGGAAPRVRFCSRPEVAVLEAVPE